MTYLSPHLNFPSSPSSSASTQRTPLPPAASTLLLTDTLSSPGGFLLQHFLSTALRSAKRVVLVGVGEGIGNFSALGKKVGTPLEPYLANSQLTYIDCLTHAASSLPLSPSASLPSNTVPPLFSTRPDQDEPTLRPLYDLIVSALKGKGKPITDVSAAGKPEGGSETETLVIIDDLSALEWMGFEVDEVERFIRGLQYKCRQLSSSLILLLHAPPRPATSYSTDPLFLALLPLSDLWIQIRGLSSGRSGAVSGELSFSPTPLMAPDPDFPTTAPGRELQYKLGDSNVTFFPKGTGEGFL